MDFRLLSHPEMLLKDHLAQVVESGLRRYQVNGIYLEHEQLMHIILAFHDIGKGSVYFQKYIVKEAPSSDTTRHSEISALWAYSYITHRLKAHPLDAIFAYVCIKYHHGNLGDISELLSPCLSGNILHRISDGIDYKEINAILESVGLNGDLSREGFKKLMQEIDDCTISSQYRRCKSIIGEDYWLKLQYLFSILIWADKYSAIFHNSAHEDIHRNWSIEQIDNYRRSLTGGLGVVSKIRNEAYDQIDTLINSADRLYSLNLPTGTGKTLNSLKVALSLKKAQTNIQRIIYCLPFTSIIDQNQKVCEDILACNSIEANSSMILPHHHLADSAYISQDELSPDEGDFLVETWDSELVITTFVQLLACMLSVMNNRLKRFHRLANSIIILDEVQNIPHYYWKLLRKVLLLLAKHMNSIVILVTATLPMVFKGEDDVVELVINKQHWFSVLDRVELVCDLIHDKTDINALAELIIRDHKQAPTWNKLIILNTIQGSLSLHQLLIEALPGIEILYLSSNVVPKQRLERIMRIKNATRTGLIIVATQVVEAGVDIDVDVVYRDLAPLDSIIQAAGRCNRNNTQRKSQVILLQLYKDNTPYWRYIYDETLVRATLDVLGVKGEVISESELHMRGCKYYDLLNRIVSSDKSNYVINNLSGLNLYSALDFHPKNNPKAFNLIDSFPTQTVFVELDCEATALLNQYNDLRLKREVDRYSKKHELRSLVRKMSKYMINVDKHLIESTEAIYVIDKDSMRQYYDFESGFKRTQSQSDYIF